MAPHGCLKVADEAVRSRRDRSTHSDGTTLMVTLGLIFVGIGIVTISLEAVGTTIVCFCIGYLLVLYA